MLITWASRSAMLNLRSEIQDCISLSFPFDSTNNSFNLNISFSNRSALLSFRANWCFNTCMIILIISVLRRLLDFSVQRRLYVLWTILVFSFFIANKMVIKIRKVLCLYDHFSVFENIIFFKNDISFQFFEKNVSFSLFIGHIFFFIIKKNISFIVLRKT